MPEPIVDATSTASILLQPGDSLAFQVMSWNFGFNAARFGLDPYSTDVSFTFVTAPIGAEASISAWLESPDSLCTAAFAGPLDFTPGLSSSSQYRGTASAAAERPASLARAFRRNFRRWFRAACAA